MNKKCPNCGLVNFPDEEKCTRCQKALNRGERSRILIRISVCLAVCVAILLGFYLSLIASARPLGYEQKATVRDAIRIVREKGFDDEARLLDSFTVYRRDDNWLNGLVAKENAFAATNFPFEIITLYSDFFTYPTDDVERAAILLHEARHLKGKDEKDAYEFVWKHRKQLGWTEDKYQHSPVWDNVRRQTREHVPNMFVCDFTDYGDCTE